MATQVFIDPYFLTNTLVIVIVLIIFNLYFLAHFNHYADAFFGASASSKGLLVTIAAIIGHRLYACSVLNSRHGLGRAKYPRKHKP